MQEPQAIDIAMAARGKFEVPAEFANPAAEKRIVEIVSTAPVQDAVPPAGPAMDYIAWVVTLSHDSSTVEFAVDDKHGAILRFRRSRNAAIEIETGKARK